MKWYEALCGWEMHRVINDKVNSQVKNRDGIKTDGHWEQQELPKMCTVQTIIFKKMIFTLEPKELARASRSRAGSVFGKDQGQQRQAWKDHPAP